MNQRYKNRDLGSAMLGDSPGNLGGKKGFPGPGMSGERIVIVIEISLGAGENVLELIVAMDIK